MRFTNAQILKSIEETGIIPVFNHSQPDVAKQVMEVAYTAGIRVFEFTNRKANAVEVFQELVSHARNYTDLVLGIGTIWNSAQAEEFIHLGADFIVSPILDEETALTCSELNKLWFPGCATFTEVINATKLGAEIVKIFPGSVLGPNFISSLLSVAPELKLMPTGGVKPTESNLKEWFEAGVVCVGMGSQLFSSELISKGEWGQLGEDISKAFKIIKGLR